MGSGLPPVTRALGTCGSGVVPASPGSGAGAWEEAAQKVDVKITNIQVNIVSDMHTGCLLLAVDSSSICAVKLDDRAETDVIISEVGPGGGC